MQKAAKDVLNSFRKLLQSQDRVMVHLRGSQTTAPCGGKQTVYFVKTAGPAQGSLPVTHQAYIRLYLVWCRAVVERTRLVVLIWCGVVLLWRGEAISCTHLYQQPEKLD
jgi:hypothetical protein